VLVDSANTAYAAGDYQTAADIYRGLTRDEPDLGVSWFGLSMAERAMGNEEAADEALEKAEARAPGLGRMHDAATDSAQRAPGMPQGHPTMPPGHPPVDGDAGMDGATSSGG
jgi:tetratricopeptide (TPR) repeat protein